MTGDSAEHVSSIWLPEQYRGESTVSIVATQLASNGLAKPSDQRRILASWIEFFRDGRHPIRDLTFASRVPQELLSSLEGQTQLEAVRVKWGSYSDLTALSGMSRLRTLSLGGAIKVADLTPLEKLLALESLVVDQPFLARDLSPISSLTGLRELVYGNAHPGSDKVVDIADFRWVAPLLRLRILQMPGTRPADPDLSILAELPDLVHLGLPLRRSYRRQVSNLSATNAAFAELARAYAGLDAMRAALSRDR